MRLFVLEGREAVEVHSMEEWAERMRFDASRIVAKSVLGDAEVSTVFIGIDYNYFGGEPHVFETMVFYHDGGVGRYTQRYSTWTEAEVGHKSIVARLGVDVYRREKSDEQDACEEESEEEC